MKLETKNIDPSKLWRPSSVARRMGKNPAMVTYWMGNNMLDYVELADGSKLIPEESVVALENLQAKRDGREEVEINETFSLDDQEASEAK